MKRCAKNTRGGAVVLSDKSVKSKDVFERIVKNRNTRLEFINVSSVGGTLYNLKFDPILEKDTYKDLTSTQDVKSITQLLMKVVIIHPSTPNPPTQRIDPNTQRIKKPNIKVENGERISFHIENHVLDNKEKEYCKTQDFLQECKTQIDIFNKSFDVFLEPICPSLLYYTIVDADFINDPANEGIRKLKEDFEFLLSTDDKFQLGIILMENISGFQPISNLLPHYSDTNPGLTHPTNPRKNNITDANKNKVYPVFDNYLFELIRLWFLGYVHGDTHLSNAMFVDNYDYLYGKRVYLIDFGRTVKHNYDTKDVFSMYTRINTRMSFWSYEILRQYMLQCILKDKSEIISKDNLLTMAKIDNTWLANMFKERVRTREVFFERLRTTPRLFKEITESYPQFDYKIYYKVFSFNNVHSKEDHVKSITWVPIEQIRTPFEYEGVQTALNIPTEEDYDVLKSIIKSNYSLLNNDYMFEIPTEDGIYKWVLYTDSNEVNIVFYKTLSFHEILSLHSSVIFLSGATKIYSCGEVMKVGNNYKFNYLSEIYMSPIFQQNPDDFNKRIKLSNIVITYLFLNKFGEHNRSLFGLSFFTRSFIKPNLPMHKNMYDFLKDHISTLYKENTSSNLDLFITGAAAAAEQSPTTLLSKRRSLDTEADDYMGGKNVAFSQMPPSPQMARTETIFEFLKKPAASSKKMALAPVQIQQQNRSIVASNINETSLTLPLHESLVFRENFNEFLSINKNFIDVYVNAKMTKPEIEEYKQMSGKKGEEPRPPENIVKEYVSVAAEDDVFEKFLKNNFETDEANEKATVFKNNCSSVQKIIAMQRGYNLSLDENSILVSRGAVVSGGKYSRHRDIINKKSKRRSRRHSSGRRRKTHKKYKNKVK